MLLCKKNSWCEFGGLYHEVIITKGFQLGVANGKCETLQDGETSGFLCEHNTFYLFRMRKIETSKCFECEREAFRLLKLKPQIWLRATCMRN